MTIEDRDRARTTRHAETRSADCRGREPPRGRADRGPARGPAVRRGAAAVAGARSRGSRAWTAATVDERLGDLEVTLAQRGIRVVLAGDRVELATAPEAGALVARYVGADAVRLSPASLETLAIVAYRQPITRAGIERIRGVDSDYTVRALVHRRLIAEQGRSEAPGRPILYGTGFEFLERFGLTSLDDLPPLEVEIAPAWSTATARGRGRGDRRRRRGPTLPSATGRTGRTRSGRRGLTACRRADLEGPRGGRRRVAPRRGRAGRRGPGHGRRPAAILGEKVDPATQRIEVDRRAIVAAPARHVYLALHKPAGVASTVTRPARADDGPRPRPAGPRRAAPACTRSAGSTRTPRG